MPYISINPYTEETLKTFSSTTNQELEKTLAEGHAAFLKWKETSFEERAAILRKVAELLLQNLHDYTNLMAEETGKRPFEGEWEIRLCAGMCTYYADHGAEILKPQKIKAAAPDTGESILQPTPQGIILSIAPWNVPFYQAFKTFAPQIMAGNTVILKHSPSTPQCAEAALALMEKAGLPKHVFQIIFTENDQTETIIRDPRIRGVVFTGSTQAGAFIASMAAKYIKKTALELGGSDAFIVLEDAPLEKTVQTALFTRHFNAGQICISPKRMIIVDSVYDDFLNAYKKAAQQIKAGDPKDPSTTLGPLINKAALDRLNAQVEEAKKQGVKVETIGAPVPEKGYFFQPVLLTGLEGKEIRHEEFFGPVTQIYRVKNEQEAIALANESVYGLSGSVHTADEARGMRVAQQIDSGSFVINSALFTSPNTPFGGVKNSGYGRDLGHDGILEFMNLKLIHIAK